MCMHEVFNFRKKLLSINKAASQQRPPVTLRSAYNDSCLCLDRHTKSSLCPRIMWKVQELFPEKYYIKLYTTCMQWVKVYDTYINSKGEKVYTQVWKQVDCVGSLSQLFQTPCSQLTSTIIQHIFANDVQYEQQQRRKRELPLDHDISVGDFSQNNKNLQQWNWSSTLHKASSNTTHMV